MRISRLARVLLVLCAVPVFLAWGQTTPAATSSTAASAPAQVSLAELTAVVQKQFGSGFEVVTAPPMSKIGGAKVMSDQPDYTAWSPLLIGDFDGDGVEDAVIIARNKNALIESDAYHYKVTD